MFVRTRLRNEVNYVRRVFKVVFIERNGATFLVKFLSIEKFILVGLTKLIYMILWMVRSSLLYDDSSLFNIFLFIDNIFMALQNTFFQ